MKNVKWEIYRANKWKKLSKYATLSISHKTQLISSALLGMMEVESNFESYYFHESHKSGLL